MYGGQSALSSSLLITNQDPPFPIILHYMEIRIRLIVGQTIKIAMSVSGHFFFAMMRCLLFFFCGVTVGQEGVDSAPMSSPPPQMYYWFYSVEILVIITS